ncbi:MAG: NUDIX hydrolase [Desulfobacterales bacterium]|nr:NUDIX hydrolase [Desulfobacterales bacterium]
MNNWDLSHYPNPWKRLNSTFIYANPWIHVQEDQVINPSGGEGIYGLVKFKNFAIGIIPIDEFGNTWLVGQYRYALDAYSWEIPMGGGPKHELPIETAKRELKEETGLTAIQWTEIAHLHTSNSVTDEEGWVFVAQDLTQGAPELEPTEDLTVYKLRFDEAIKWVLQGKITDAISVAGIMKLALTRQVFGF